MKTGGYDKHSKHQEKDKQVDRNKTTKDFKWKLIANSSSNYHTDDCN